MEQGIRVLGVVGFIVCLVDYGHPLLFSVQIDTEE